MADKAKETVMEDVLRLKTLVVEAISSGAYLYPLKVKLSGIEASTTYLSQIYIEGRKRGQNKSLL